MDNEDADKYNRISVEANMKDGVKINAPATKDTGKAVNLVLIAQALTGASLRSLASENRRNHKKTVGILTFDKYLIY
ncbi:TPA: hypothetical protein LT061_005011 [Salmonella enterica subsp. enterica serovar Blitta]|nr:hypothetical protein [Salmonella enterica subsp. enterica serovar Blitta]